MMLLIVICLQNDPNTFVHLIVSGAETIYPERPTIGITILVISEATSCTRTVYLLRYANLLPFNFMVPSALHGG